MKQTRVEAAHTMLIYAKAPLFMWAKAVAIACYTQNHSLIRLHYRKTLYELLHDKKPDLSYLYVFGALFPVVAALEPADSTEEAYHDIEVAHMDNDPYFGLPIPKPSFEESFS
ncbi:hypothetical protein Tco_1468610 [Tanacetum coccineum]